MSGQLWTSLKHLKNVLSYVNVGYHFHFRVHTDTWKTASFMHCLVNIWKYTLRQNPRVRKMPVVFYRSMCIAITKPIHDICVTVFGMWKQKALVWNLTINCNSDNHWVWSRSMNSFGLVFRPKDRPAQGMDISSRLMATVRGTARRWHFSFAITSNIGVFVYMDII